VLLGRICRVSLQTTMIKQPAEGSAAAKAPSEKAPGTSEPGWAAYLGGAALVGAAAGYAALALRFKNLGSRTDFTTGGAEFRAAQAFSRDWSKVSEQAERLSADEVRDRARRAYQESFGAGASGRGSSSRTSQQQHQHQQQQHGVPPHQWALDELGLCANPSLSEAKRAYHERARACHPDSGGPNADAEDFKRLSRAWDEVQKHAKKAE